MPFNDNGLTPQLPDQAAPADAHRKTPKEHPSDRDFVNDCVELFDKQKLEIGRFTFATHQNLRLYLDICDNRGLCPNKKRMTQSPVCYKRHRSRLRSSPTLSGSIPDYWWRWPGTLIPEPAATAAKGWPSSRSSLWRVNGDIMRIERTTSFIEQNLPLHVPRQVIR